MVVLATQPAILFLLTATTAVLQLSGSDAASWLPRKTFAVGAASTATWQHSAAANLNQQQPQSHISQYMDSLIAAMRGGSTGTSTNQSSMFVFFLDSGN